jgi:CheY-like chemotaxis protein
MGDNGRAVLIVEDSENTAATLEIALLGIPGVSVLMAHSAVEALRILDRDGAAVSAVVTDLNMPRMDGFELIQRIRQDRRLAATPIIVVSADTDPGTPRRVA